MKRLLAFVGTTVVVVAAAVSTLAATTPSAATTKHTPTKHTLVVAKQVSGVGSVLATASGLALYVNNRDSATVPHCNGACTVAWPPLMVHKGTSVGKSKLGKLGVVKRANGTRQLTFNGKPVYTFSADKPGTVTGNGITDRFGGMSFTWHVVKLGGSGSSSPSPSSAPGGSGSSSPSPSSAPGGY